MSRLARRGISLVAVAATLALFLFGARAAWLAMSTPAAAAGPVTELRTALIRAGLGANSLAAAGISNQETSSVVSAFATAVANDPDALEQADTSYVTARASRDALQRTVRSGLATQQEVADLATAKTALASAEAARTTVLQGWFEDATTNLPNGKVATLEAIHANADWKLPIEFLVTDRSEADWVALRDALANERICAKYGDPPDQGMQTALASWRADASVAAAKTAFDANLAAIQSAWDTASGD